MPARWWGGAPALAAGRWCAVGRRYYDALRQRGPQHKEALVIIARKLLRAAHALAQNPDGPVDHERLFALPA